MTPQDVAEMKSLWANVPADLYSRFESLAKSHDRSLSAEVRRAMRGHLEREVPGEKLRSDGEANGGAA